MLFLHMPAILVALIPIIAIEMYVASRLLGRRMLNSFGPIAAANAVSMLLGFPLLWLVGVLGEMLVGYLGENLFGMGSADGLETWWQKLYAVTVQAPWLIPYEKDIFWMIPVAGLVMLIPAFFLSVWSERLVLQRFWREEQNEVLRRFSFRAHLASYLVLILIWIGYGVYFCSQKRPNKSLQPTPMAVTDHAEHALRQP